MEGTATPDTDKGRIPYFDLAKGICILLVVWYHLGAGTPFDIYLNAIRMPLYVFLSGLFFKTYGGLRGLMRRKTKKLLVPFFFFYMTTSVLLPVVLHKIGGMSFGTGQDWKLLYAFLTYHDFPNIPLWFLWGLFILNVSFYALQRCVKSEVLLGILCLGLSILLGYVLALPASLSRAFGYMFFFYLGYVVRQHDLLQRVSVGYVLPASLMLFVALGIPNPASDALLLVRQYMMSVCGVLSLVLLCKLIGHLPYVSYVGRYSIMLLVTHEPLIRILNFMHVDNAVPCFLILLTAYLFIIPFMRRYMPHVTAQT